MKRRKNNMDKSTETRIYKTSSRNTKYTMWVQERSVYDNVDGKHRKKQKYRENFMTHIYNKIFQSNFYHILWKNGKN